MIIITAPVHPILLDTLSEKGYEFIYQPKMDYESLCNQIHQATGLIVATQIKIDRHMLDRAVNLKWIGRLGSGMEHIDVSYALKRNIKCISSPEGNRNAVAEFALGLLLCLMRNIHISSDEVKNFEWKREVNRGEELSGKTIGIIGYGNTGAAFARLLSSFDVTILVFDKYKSNIKEDYIKESSLEDIKKYSDIVSLHLPLNSETEHFVDGLFLDQLMRCPIIINTSRGGVVDTISVLKAIEHEKIKGLALDVLENENLTSYSLQEQHLLRQLSGKRNVIITPHIAGYTFQASYKMSTILLEKLGIL